MANLPEEEVKLVSDKDMTFLLNHAIEKTELKVESGDYAFVTYAAVSEGERENVLRLFREAANDKVLTSIYPQLKEKIVVNPLQTDDGKNRHKGFPGHALRLDLGNDKWIEYVYPESDCLKGSVQRIKQRYEIEQTDHLKRLARLDEEKKWLYLIDCKKAGEEAKYLFEGKPISMPELQSMEKQKVENKPLFFKNKFATYMMIDENHYHKIGDQNYVSFDNAYIQKEYEKRRELCDLEQVLYGENVYLEAQMDFPADSNNSLNQSLLWSNQAHMQPTLVSEKGKAKIKYHKKPLLTNDSASLLFIFHETCKRKTVDQTIEKVEEQIIGQSAPQSHIGDVKTSGLSPEEAMFVLKHLGIIDEPEEKVPYEHLYKGRSRFGFQKTSLAAYQKQKLQLPEIPGIWHTITGANNEQEVMEKLQSIVENGGILSTKQRLLHNINTKSITPLGDMATGIDDYVPTTIAEKTIYDGDLKFSFRPELLQKRDLFMAEHDPGAGEESYERYQSQAKQLGQKDLFDPPSHASRVKHLKHLRQYEGRSQSNEVWFRQSLGTEEIEKIHVNKNFGQLIKQIKEYKKQGLLPSELEIVYEEPSKPSLF